MIPRYDDKKAAEAWQLLVHVCRRWRTLVLDSPRRLNLRLFCTPTNGTLDIWPTLPLIVRSYQTSEFPRTDSIITALGHSNRVCKVDLYVTRQMENVLAAMQVPFPELTDLAVGSSTYELPPVIPNSFLGGSAPRLRHFKLANFEFPELPKLHLSAPHLVHLTISHTRHPWYISSKAMAALLSPLSSLNTLSLEFEYLEPLRDRETLRPPPSKRSVIPTLTSFKFKGDIEYLENLVTFIDTPRLDSLLITVFDQIDVDTPQLAEFINRTSVLKAPDEAHEFR